MDKVSIILRRSPYGTVNAGEAIRHLLGAESNNFKGYLFLVDDGVYTGKKGQSTEGTEWINLAESFSMISPEEELSPEVYAEEESAKKRGLTGDDLVEGIKITNMKFIAKTISESKGFLIF
ncbi:MAG: DsrE family protein [Nitrospirota bacterium]